MSIRLNARKKRDKTKTSFKKGNKAAQGHSNKGLTSPGRKEVKQLRKIDNILVVSYLTVNSHKNQTELRDHIKDPNISSLERAIATTIHHASNGSLDCLNFVLDRLIGRVTNKLEVTRPDPYADKTIEELEQIKLQLENQAREVIYVEFTHSDRAQQQNKQLETALNDGSKEAPGTEEIETDTANRTE